MQGQRKSPKLMVLPINQLFSFFTSQQTVEIWLKNEKRKRIIGTIVGFDEFMNCVIEEAKLCTVSKDGKSSSFFSKQEPIGRMLLKGENIILVAPFNA